MALPIQFGDMVAFADLALRIYEYGWSKNHRADTQYAAFGRYVKTLADNSNLLVKVVSQAEEVLRSRGAHPADYAIFDIQSLAEIVGDLRGVLEECGRLLNDNKRYEDASGVVGNIEWNIMVQPDVDTLLSRIEQHNSRIEHFIRPFEVDVMTRMYDHIVRKIDAVQDTTNQIHEILLELIKNEYPRLYAEIKSKETRRTHTIPIPPELRTALESEFKNHPDKHIGYPSLQAMSDSFFTSFEKSTKCFSPGLTLVDQIPPMLEYVCLLKSIFLMEKIKAAHDLLTAPAESHWHSYINQLADNLSIECRRFQTQMGPPTSNSISADMITLWTKEEPKDLLGAVTPQLLMDKLLECRLVPESTPGTKKVTLLRHARSNDERFRLVIEASDKDDGLEGAKGQKKIVDFNIRTSHLKPLYALPNGDVGPIEMILRADSDIIDLIFERREDALKFQQGLTGFRPWGFYTGYVPKVALFANRETIGVPASIQLWVPDRLVGTPVTNGGSRKDGRAMSITQPTSRSPSSMVDPPSRYIFANVATSPASYRELDLERQLSFSSAQCIQLNTSSPSQPIRSTFPSMERHAPSLASTGLGLNQPQSPPMPGPLATQHGSSGSRFPQGAGMFISPIISESPPSSPNLHVAQAASSQTSTPYPFSRTVPSSRKSSRVTSSATSIQASTYAHSGSSSETTVSLTSRRSEARTGILHVQPIKPMMVMFTRDHDTAGLSIISISIDNGTRPNPERCNCRQTGPAGKACHVTAIEQAQGKATIEAKKLGPYFGDADLEWDVLKLAASRRGDPTGFGGSDWNGLQRVSIAFKSPEERMKLVGGLCFCMSGQRAFTMGLERECMQRGHVGLFGEVRIKFRRDLQAYHDVINGIHDQVVNGGRMDDF